MFMHPLRISTVYQTFVLAFRATGTAPHDLAIAQIDDRRLQTQQALRRLSEHTPDMRREAGFGHAKAPNLRLSPAPRGGLRP
jgi:hypothetical protein